MPGFNEVHDPGLQQERTVLAWDRTGLALMVGAGILQRAVGWPPRGLMSVAAIVVFLTGLTLVTVGRSRYLSRWRRMRQGEGILSSGPVVTVAVATILLGVFALIVVIEASFG